MHSFFSFAKLRDVQELRGPSLQVLQDKCRNIKFVIIDEVSMIGGALLDTIDRRLRQAFPNHSDVYFGNCSIILFGDFGQLPPVMDSKLFQRDMTKPLSVRGNDAFRMFDTAFFLRQSVRQANDHVFRDLLLRLRDGLSTQEDYNLLSRRFRGTVANPEQFDHEVHLFPKKVDVDEFNESQLSLLDRPIARLESKHNCPDARHADSNVACGLSRNLSISVDSKVMLRANLWIDRGLVNGSIGTVRHIVFNRDESPPSLPAFVICHFPGYTGPSFLPDHPQTFPVVPIERTWNSGNAVFSRTALPLSLSWALTVHKCQGLTLPKSVVDIGNSEMTAGVSFVALSRVRSFEDILLAPFPAERIFRLAAHDQIRQRINEEERLRTLRR